jgi:hypothetical protein
MRNIVFAVLSVLLISDFASAFTIVLKSGTRIAGTWVSEDASAIRIKDEHGVVMTFKKSQLDLTAMKSPIHVAQTGATARVEQPRPRSDSDLSPTPPPAIPVQKAAKKPWSLYANVANAYDSNINHDEDHVESVGVIYGAGARYRSDAFVVEYEIASHNYSHTDKWDRISHDFTGAFQYPISNAFELQLQGEASFLGSSEDRELSNQYIVKPVLNYRMSKRYQIDFFGAARLKRFPNEEDQGRNASDPFAGAEFEADFGHHAFQVSYRYERNMSDDPKYEFTRSVYGIDYVFDFSRSNRLALEFDYKPQHYVYRLVEIDIPDAPDIEFLRRDVKYKLGVDFRILVGNHFQIEPVYEYEWRTSNDPDKHYTAHQPSLLLRYVW